MDVLLLRCRTFDAAVHRLATTYAALRLFQVAVLIDERNGPQDTGDFAKVSVTQEAYTSLGVFVPSDVAWRCGDYGFYLARRQFPSAEYFWLIEDDVRIKFADLTRFFQEYSTMKHHLLCAGFGASDESWWWHKTMAKRFDAVYKCLFPVVRLSANATDFLLSRRIAYGVSASDWNWPNDEALVATELMNANFACADLGLGHPGSFSPASFGFTRPHSLIRVEGMKPDGNVYHPVVTGAAFRRKVDAFLARNPHGLAAIKYDLAVEGSCAPSSERGLALIQTV